MLNSLLTCIIIKAKKKIELRTIRKMKTRWKEEFSGRHNRPESLLLLDDDYDDDDDEEEEEEGGGGEEEEEEEG